MHFIWQGASISMWLCQLPDIVQDKQGIMIAVKIHAVPLRQVL